MAPFVPFGMKFPHDGIVRRRKPVGMLCVSFIPNQQNPTIGPENALEFDSSLDTIEPMDRLPRHDKPKTTGRQTGVFRCTIDAVKIGIAAQIFFGRGAWHHLARRRIPGCRFAKTIR